MANIDLRPWREERRAARQTQFLIILGVIFVTALGAGFYWNSFVQGNIGTQNIRNAYLRDRISELDIKITEIQSLRDQREELIDRMDVIQSLQGDRPIIVNVFEELVRATPEGVYFDELDASGNQIRISAQADRTLSISDFLRNLDASEWFDDTFMVGMESIKQGQEVVGHKFRLTVTRTNPSSETEDES